MVSAKRVTMLFKYNTIHQMVEAATPTDVARGLRLFVIYLT